MGDLSKPKPYHNHLEEEMSALIQGKKGTLPELTSIDVVMSTSNTGKTGEYLAGKKSTTAVVVVTEELLNWLDSEVSRLNSSSTPLPPLPPSIPPLLASVTSCIKSSPGRITGRTFSSLPPPHLATLKTLGLLTTSTASTSATTAVATLHLSLPCASSLRQALQSSRRRFVIALHASYHREILQAEGDRKHGEWLTWTGVGEGWWGWKEVSGGRGMYYLL
ncbi:hypothetical protein TrRE_jg4115 [Triparma retinervis]|uniref:Uncharacterized protein n=1 Tax=Triparma retinervis TaxID=2557542 RepID=A0A9W6ZK18_9STRA|nr:hypothetical protein TrRE_jg4115 [Triparma retinervis]